MSDKKTFNKKKLTNGEIVIVNKRYAPSKRTNTALGRAFVIEEDKDTLEKVNKQLEKSIKASVGGYWLEDTKRQNIGIMSNWISITETKKFREKEIAVILENLAVEFYSILQSVMTNWVIEDFNGEQSSVLSRIIGAKPFIDFAKNKKEEECIPQKEISSSQLPNQMSAEN